MGSLEPDIASFQNQFLVSMPQLNDPNFKQTVILILKHDVHGAIGLVINRLIGLVINDIFEQLEIASFSNIFANRPVLDGGPVYPELGLIVHSSETDSWESSMPVGDSLMLTSSRDILDDMAIGKGPKNVVMSLGYAGWAPGQLEKEIQENAWFTTPIDHEILFSSDVTHKWQAAAKLIGIDTNQFSHQVGHA